MLMKFFRKYGQYLAKILKKFVAYFFDYPIDLTVLLMWRQHLWRGNACGNMVVDGQLPGWTRFWLTYPLYDGQCIGWGWSATPWVVWPLHWCRSLYANTTISVCSGWWCVIAHPLLMSSAAEAFMRPYLTRTYRVCSWMNSLTVLRSRAVAASSNYYRLGHWRMFSGRFWHIVGRKLS